jgi:hypothetical protein
LVIPRYLGKLPPGGKAVRRTGEALERRATTTHVALQHKLNDRFLQDRPMSRQLTFSALVAIAVTALFAATNAVVGVAVAFH